MNELESELRERLKAMHINTQANPASFGELRVYGGQRLKDVNPHALAAWGVKVGVPGMSSENGLQQNCSAYAAHLDKIGKEAADAAIDAWLAGHSGAA